jgi:phage I-like protein
LALHKKLIENEGYDAKSDEYYEAIDSYMKKKFPQEFTSEDKSVSKDEQNTNIGNRKPVQSVASATRTAKSGRKTVRLTSAQVNVAKRLGVPISEYAKYVKEQ